MDPAQTQRIHELFRLEKGADPAQSEDLAPLGRALHTAASRNDVEIAELLLKHGANPNAGVDSSADCLWISRHSHPEDCAQMQELLRRYGARPIVPWSDDQLIEALATGERLGEDFLNYLFRSENQEALDLFFERHTDRVPSLVAGNYWGGDLPTLELLDRLLDCGLDPNLPNWIGRTFLHVAAEKGSVPIAEALLDAGADIEAVELEYGGTPLAAAARKGQVDMVSFLLEKGADLDNPRESPWATAPAWAERTANEDIAGLLSD